MSKEIFEEKWWQQSPQDYAASEVSLRALMQKDVDEPTKDVSIVGSSSSSSSSRSSCGKEKRQKISSFFISKYHSL